MSKTILICGAGGFIGHHLARRLTGEGNKVVGVDLKFPEFSPVDGDFYQFHRGDLRDKRQVMLLFQKYEFDEIFQLAADMGGAGYIFTGDNDTNVMLNSSQININVLEAILAYHSDAKVFYSSSACIYPKENQENPSDPKCSEESAYPANPDSEYGWEKLFSERLWTAAARNYGLNVRIARFHNIFGPEGTYDGGKEKAPAALSRKVAQTANGGIIDVWGDGKQTRSFLYIDECLDGIIKLMESDVTDVVNIGSAEMVSIQALAQKLIDISGKTLNINNIDGPEGVRGRTSDNKLIRKLLDWSPSLPLDAGLKKTYDWIQKSVMRKVVTI